ncbi:toxin-activating lysine-acyltransferase [Vibrio owensii]|uniref:toxin-activating lysine-acyltransferase n=1 Tax=Vibrio owensii TaxID=696485 RepID=UPI0005EF23ED|nr:toxin-activating lysine-acyltransferase [Vibrio owensii]
MQLCGKDKCKSNSEKNHMFLNRNPHGKYKETIFKELGQLLEITSHLKERQSINISSFLHWVKPAVLHDQYVLIKNKGEIEHSGYLMWAWVSERTLTEFITQERFALHPMCWNEGDNLIVVDFAIANSSQSKSVIREMYRKARRQAGISHKSIKICIRDNTGKVVKHNVKGDFYEC